MHPTLTDEGRLPSALLHTYVQYKRDTKAVIEWLVSHGASKYRKMRSLSIKDLFKLAETIKQKAVDMPESVGFHFREAITARTQLSNYFRKQSAASLGGAEETQNHEYFTTRYASSFV